MEDFIEIIGNEPGPTSVILAGVHGDERGGIDAFKKILSTLAIEKGKVFLGYGNPRAILVNKRFTEQNLNRMFKEEISLSEGEKQSYEYERAQYIKQYLNQADALLDLHSSYVPNSKPFIICEPKAYNIVEFLKPNIVVSGFDKIQPGGTDYYMNKKGGIGICVECGYLSDVESVSIATESILGFLMARGHTSGDMIRVDKKYFNIYEMYMTKTDTFKRAEQFRDFDTLQSGALIGLDGAREIFAPKESIILFAKDCIKSNEEAFLLGEQKSDLV